MEELCSQVFTCQQVITRNYENNVHGFYTLKTEKPMYEFVNNNQYSQLVSMIAFKMSRKTQRQAIPIFKE